MLFKYNKNRMGCLESNTQNYKEPIYNIPIKIINSGNKKDELDVYEYESDSEYRKFLSHGPYFICPLCNQRFSENEMKEIEKFRLYDYQGPIAHYLNTINSQGEDIFERLEKLAEEIENEKNIVENAFYKYKCIPNNISYYIKLYMYPYPGLNYYLKKRNHDE